MITSFKIFEDNISQKDQKEAKEKVDKKHKKRKDNPIKWKLKKGYKKFIELS